MFTLIDKMSSTRRTARGRYLKSILQSDINHKSTCISLQIPHEIVYHTYKPKLCVLTARLLIKIQKLKDKNLGGINSNRCGITIG